MKTDNIIQQKSYSFAVRVVKMCQHLVTAKKERVLSKQVVRSGTSVGANVEEAIGAQSRPDFVAKVSVAYKEARETKYWLRLLRDTGYLTDTAFEAVHDEADELCRLLSSILTSTKGRT